MTSSYGLNIPLLSVLILLGMLAILQMRLQLQVVLCRVRHSLVLSQRTFKSGKQLGVIVFLRLVGLSMILVLDLMRWF